MNDLIDIGVFSGGKGHEKELYLAKHRIAASPQKFIILVNDKPTRAGIDPYNKLLGRKPDDNWVDVAKM